MAFGKSEDELTPREKDKLTQDQMDTQLHWNFHTIYNILFTDEDRVEVERICEERNQVYPNWEEEVSPYAERSAKEERNDEVFCEFGMRFMTCVKRSDQKKLEKLNPELYSFILLKID